MGFVVWKRIFVNEIYKHKIWVLFLDSTANLILQLTHDNQMKWESSWAEHGPLPMFYSLQVALNPNPKRIEFGKILKNKQDFFCENWLHHTLQINCIAAIGKLLEKSYKGIA